MYSVGLNPDALSPYIQLPPLFAKAPLYTPSQESAPVILGNPTQRCIINAWKERIRNPAGHLFSAHRKAGVTHMFGPPTGRCRNGTGRRARHCPRPRTCHRPRPLRGRTPRRTRRCLPSRPSRRTCGSSTPSAPSWTCAGLSTGSASTGTLSVCSLATRASRSVHEPPTLPTLKALQRVWGECLASYLCPYWRPSAAGQFKSLLPLNIRCHCQI